MTNAERFEAYSHTAPADEKGFDEVGVRKGNLNIPTRVVSTDATYGLFVINVAYVQARLLAKKLNKAEIRKSEALIHNS